MPDLHKAGCSCKARQKSEEPTRGRSVLEKIASTDEKESSDAQLILGIVATICFVAGILVALRFGD